MIATLIDKQDSVEIIRDQIAVLLASEVAAQKALATTAGKDPNLWDLKVFAERINPIEEYLNDTASFLVPVVDVMFDSSAFQLHKSDLTERQGVVATYSIDCYGFGISEDVPGGGHTPGDMTGSLEAQRAAMLVRNILMAGENRFLGLDRSVAWDRWITGTQMMHSDKDHQSVQKISCARIEMTVATNEFSPQVIPGTIAEINVDLKRASDGSVLAQATYI